MIASNELYLETGYYRPSNYNSYEIFFTYILPQTKLEAPLPRCPFIKKIWVHSSGEYNSGNTWIVKTLYTVTADIKLKMININASFGIMRKGWGNFNPRPLLYINVTPNEGTLIELTGLNGYGKISCYGNIDYNQSYLKTEVDLKRLHNLKIVNIKPSATKQKRNVLW